MLLYSPDCCLTSPEPDLNSSGVEKVLEEVNMFRQSGQVSGLFAQDDGLSQDQTVKPGLFTFPGLDALNTGPGFTIITNNTGRRWQLLYSHDCYLFNRRKKVLIRIYIVTNIACPG